jgi:hypothetical protein
MDYNPNFILISCLIIKVIIEEKQRKENESLSYDDNGHNEMFSEFSTNQIFFSHFLLGQIQFQVLLLCKLFFQSCCFNVEKKKSEQNKSFYRPFSNLFYKKKAKKNLKQFYEKKMNIKKNLQELFVLIEENFHF